MLPPSDSYRKRLFASMKGSPINIIGKIPPLKSNNQAETPKYFKVNLWIILFYSAYTTSITLKQVALFHAAHALKQL